MLNLEYNQSPILNYNYNYANVILHHLIWDVNKAAVNIPQAVLHNYKKPKPHESLSAEFIIYFMSSSSVMCTGNFMDRSHVDVVGRQRQP